MTEKYWDPLNRAAILVTLFTGVPAFLTFMGLPYIAAILLGIFSISSLSFVLIRGRALESRGNRLAALNKNDEKLIKRFNEIIAGKHIDSTPSTYIQDLLMEALENIKKYIEEDVSCEAVVSLREIKPNMDVVPFLSSRSQSAKPVVFKISQTSGFHDV